jgi:hypothetical protein
MKISYTLAIFSISGAACASAPCPADMVAYLASNDQTSIQFRATVDRCKDQQSKLTGEIINIDNKRDGKYLIKLAPPIQKGRISSGWYEITLAEKHNCGDLLAIKKGATVSFLLKITKFDGYSNHWATAENAICTK